MKCALLMCALAAGAAAAHAQANDPLWLQAQQHLHAGRAWVAQQVNSRYSVDEAGKTRTATADAALTGWQGSTPQRQATTQGDQELMQLAHRALPNLLNPADRPDAVLLPATSAVRVDTPRAVDGRPAQAFAVRGSVGSKQRAYSGQVLLDPATGAPLQLDYQFEPQGPMKAMRYSVHFSVPQEALPALPDSASLQVDLRVPLLGESTIRHQQRFLSWALRPPAAQLPATPP